MKKNNKKMSRDLRRVVVSGLGAITPIGNSVAAFRSGLWEGRCGIAPITLFDASDFSVSMAAELKDYRPEDHFDRKTVRRLDRSAQVALIAAREALADSGIDMSMEDPHRIGCIVGEGVGGLGTIETECRKLFEGGPRRISPLFIPMAIVNMPSGNVSIELGTKGICYAPVTACASGTDAIGQAYLAVADGRQDVIFAGGGESSVIPLAIGGFQSMKALSTSKDPLRASIPFDAERDGFVLGEGSAFLVLETLEHAKARGAKIYAEILGYGQSSDAYHITAPDESGQGGAWAMKLAIDDAGLQPEDIHYINAHGTSTRYNDAIETKAIKVALGETAARQVAVSSTKAMTGHLLGGAGAVEALACVLAIQDQKIPATIHHKIADPECDLDYVSEGTRRATVDYCLSNSLGFGGHNASLCIGRFSE